MAGSKVPGLELEDSPERGEALNLIYLPEPVLYRIVRELCPDALDIVRVSLSCKTLQRTSDDVSIWQRVLELRFGENILPAPEQAGTIPNCLPLTPRPALEVALLCGKANLRLARNIVQPCIVFLVFWDYVL
jgi:hypothetical protein